MELNTVRERTRYLGLWKRFLTLRDLGSMWWRFRSHPAGRWWFLIRCFLQWTCKPAFRPPLSYLLPCHCSAWSTDRCSVVSGLQWGQGSSEQSRWSVYRECIQVKWMDLSRYLFFPQTSFCLPLDQETFKTEVTKAALRRIWIYCICKYMFLSNRKKPLIWVGCSWWNLLTWAKVDCKMIAAECSGVCFWNFTNMLWLQSCVYSGMISKYRWVKPIQFFQHFIFSISMYSALQCSVLYFQSCVSHTACKQEDSVTSVPSQHITPYFFTPCAWWLIVDCRRQTVQLQR